MLTKPRFYVILYSNSALINKGDNIMEILLRSSWQTVNIGDISHTPALLALIEKHIPEATVTVWATEGITKEVLEMEHKRFPNVTFVTGDDSNPDILAAIDRADFFLHGSGPYMAGANELKQFLKHSDKPYGIFGITYRDDPVENELLNGAEFAYFRDSKSLEIAKNNGIHAKVMQFGPDAAFAIDLSNDEKADKFLAENDLKEGEFLCCIPRLRWTPYWELRDVPFNAERDAKNKEKVEQDHVYLRKAITDIIEKTDKKVLICPEDMTQMKVGKEAIYDKLPESVLSRVVLKKDYWLTDEAVSVYKKSLGLFGNEMHSPIMCIGNNVPAIVCRWEEQTTKGFMWNDIGLGDWLFDSDKGIDAQQFSDTVLTFVNNRAEVLAKTKKAKDYVDMLFADMMKRVKELIS